MNIVQWPTRNFGYPTGAHGRNGQAIVAIVDHIMQGYLAGYHSYLTDPDKNSATFSVYRDGHVDQHVPIADAAWCNGPMAAPDLSVPFIKRCFESHINPNLVTVSIEHEGLTGVAWPEAQIVASIELHKYILAHCPGILPDRQHIVGHYQIDSINKSHCPGTAMPWARLMAALQPPITHEPNIPANPTGGTDMTAAEQAQIKTWTGEIAAALESYGKGMDAFEALHGQTAWAKARRAEKDLIWDRALTKLRTLAGLQ